MRLLLLRFPILVAFVFFLSAAPLPPSALASRTELDSRGLPRLLAVDEINLGLLPGSAIEISPELQLDVGVGCSDEFALAMAGATWRYAYLLDGAFHHLLLASPSGWGVTLGFRGTTITSEVTLDEPPSTREQERWSREVALGLGYAKHSLSGRLWEFGVRGSYLDTGDNSSQADSAMTLVYDGRGQGYGVELVVRTLAERYGWLLSARVGYEDPKPEFSGSGGDLQGASSFAGLDVAYRIDVRAVDDLVAGVTASWNENTRKRARLTPFSSLEETTTSSNANASLFVSLEQFLLPAMPIRAGVRGGVGYGSTESTLEADSGAGTNMSSSTSWSFRDPTVFIGLGWTHKALTLDARFRTDINLDTPVISWAGTFRFE